MDITYSAQNKQPRFTSRLQFRLILLVALLFFPALFIALLTIAEQHNSATNAARQQALVFAQLTAANHEQIVTGTQRVLMALSQVETIRHGESETEACNALFVRLREQYESYTNFYMVDTRGNTICTGLPDAPSPDLFSLAWYRRALETEGFSVSDYALGAVSRRPILTFSYPIYDEDGQKRYLLATGLNLEWMNTFIKASDLPSGATLTIIDQSGTVLYRYPNGDLWLGLDRSNEPLVQSIVHQHTGTTDALGLDQVGRFYGFTPLDEHASAFIVVGLAQEVAYAQSRTLLLQNLMGFAILGIGVVVLAVYGGERFFLRPINQLVDAAASLAKGSLKTRVDLRSLQDTYELSELGIVFNAMASSHENTQEELERKVQDRTRELMLLVEASAILSSSLDYELTLAAVTKLIVPHFADWCAIDLLDDEGVLQRLAVTHQDPLKAQWAEETHRRYPPDPETDTGVYHVVRTRQAALYPHISDEMLKMFTQDETQLQLLREAGLSSVILVPLIARDRVLGVLTLVLANPKRQYTPDDLKLTKELANRAAAAIDNAQLYRELGRQREQLQVTLASIGDAVIATDAAGDIVFINDVAQQLTQWDEAGAVGKPLTSVFKIVDETTHTPVENPADKIFREGKIIGLANHTLLITRDGTHIPIDDSGAPIFDDDHNLIGTILVFRDITERRRNEQRITLLLELSSAFSQALTSAEIAEVVVDKGLKALGASVGVVSLLTEQKTQLQIINRRGLSAESVEKYLITPLDFPGPLNDAVRTGELVWIEAFDQYVARYPQFEPSIRRNGSRSTICMPLIVNGEVLGGFNLSFPFDNPRNARDEAFFTALAQQCAQSLERSRLYDAEHQARKSAEETQQQMMFLAAASTALANSLDLQVTLDQIAQLVVPDLADWSHIDLYEDGTVRRFAVKHVNPEKTALLYEMNQQFPARLDAIVGAGKVIRTGKSDLLSDVPEGYLEQIAQNEQHAALRRELNICSLAVVPLTAHGTTFGAVTFGSSTRGHFTEADLALLEEFGRRAAISILKAQLYQSEKSARTRADQNLSRINRLQQVTASLSEVLSLEQMGKTIVQQTHDALYATSALLVLLNEDQQFLELAGAMGYHHDFLQFWQHLSLVKAPAFIAESLRTKTPLWNVREDEVLQRVPRGSALAESDEIRAILPLHIHNRTYGALVLSFPSEQAFMMDDKTFILTMIQQCAQALERAYLHERAKESATEVERQRLARDLHDAVSQVLFSSTCIAEVLPRLWQRDPDRAMLQLDQVISLNRAAMAEMRSLLLELRPEMIVRTEMRQLLDQLLKAVKGRETIETELVVEGVQESLVEPDVKVAFYRIAQETLNNVVKHSRAAHVTIELSQQANRLTMSIADDGNGFDTRLRGTGLGLHTMRERAAAIGGSFEIQSQPDQGTRITLQWEMLTPGQEQA